MRVAIVHDFLAQMGGAEKVVEVFHEMFPEAPVYTSVYDADAMPDAYRAWDIRTSFLQRMPYKRFTHRAAFLLYPLAFESFDLNEYDLVLSSSSAFAKGVITQPHTAHICYTHAPMRYGWTPRAYMRNERASRLTRLLLAPGLHYLRLWDYAATARVDRFVANSSAVAKRISKFYRQDSDVVFPPVDTARFTIADSVGDYYLIAARFVPYKRLDLAVEAFTMLDRPLKVVGDGRQRRALQAIAGKNIEFLGTVDNAAMPDLMAHARAYILPGEEDFGIAPVEANSCGRPVIAFAAGGAMDSQIDGKTGVLFSDQSVGGLCKAVLRMDSISFDPIAIRRHSQRFNTESFRQGIWSVIEQNVDYRIAPDELSEAHAALVS